MDPECKLRVLCCLDAGWADVEVVGRVAGCPIVARVEGADMYDAIDVAFDKVTTQTVRRHGRRVRRNRRRTDIITATA
jgi:ribosome-associated translation inhibitor RaiA